MGYPALTRKKTVLDNVSVTSAGFIGERFSLPSNADNIAMAVVIESGTVSTLTSYITQDINGTDTGYSFIDGMDTNNTSGMAFSAATEGSTGNYKAYFGTVTSPSSLVVSMYIYWNERN